MHDAKQADRFAGVSPRKPDMIRVTSRRQDVPRYRIRAKYERESIAGSAAHAAQSCQPDCANGLMQRTIRIERKLQFRARKTVRSIFKIRLAIKIGFRKHAHKFQSSAGAGLNFSHFRKGRAGVLHAQNTPLGVAGQADLDIAGAVLKLGRRRFLQLLAYRRNLHNLQQQP